MNGRYVTVPVRNHENPQGLTAALAAFPAGLSAKDPRADVRELLTKLVPDWAGVAPPSKVMKSRRRMSRPPARGTAYRIVEQGIVVRLSKSRPREGRYGSFATGSSRQQVKPCARGATPRPTGRSQLMRQ